MTRKGINVFTISCSVFFMVASQVKFLGGERIDTVLNVLFPLVSSAMIFWLGGMNAYDYLQRRNNEYKNFPETEYSNHLKHTK